MYFAMYFLGILKVGGKFVKKSALSETPAVATSTLPKNKPYV